MTVPSHLTAALEANRALPDQSLESVVAWFLSEPELAALARKHIVQVFRAKHPAPKRKPSMVFV